MELYVGATFTGKWFTGKVLVQEIIEETNELKVRLQSEVDCTDDDYWWFETWDLGVTVRGFNTGDYFPIPESESKLNRKFDGFDKDLAELNRNEDSDMREAIKGLVDFTGRDVKELTYTLSEGRRDYNIPTKTYSNPIVRDSPKIGRNTPCPCDSGLKYKQCCLNK